MEDKLTPLEAEVMEVSARQEPEQAFDSYGTAARPKPKRNFVLLWVLFGIGVIILSSLAVIGTLFDVRLERKNGYWTLQMRNHTTEEQADVRELPITAGMLPTQEDADRQDSIRLHIAGGGASSNGSPAEIYKSVFGSVVCLEYSTCYGTAYGTGVVLTEDGYLLTASANLSDVLEIEAVFENESRHPATILKVDRTTGLALLKTEANGLTPVSFSPESSAAVGTDVYCFSNPYGTAIKNVFSAGMLSAVQQHEINDDTYTLLLTSCERQSEGYGVPIFDASGCLLGMTSPIGQYLFVGADPCFAIGSSDLQRIVGELTNSAKTETDLLGLTVEAIPASYAGYYHYPGSLWITGIRSDSPLYGYLREYDVVTAVDGKEVATVEEYRQELLKASTSGRLQLTVYRNRSYFNVTVTLKNT